MKEEEKEKQEGEKEKRLRVWDCGSPLYDSFEVASLCHLLDRNLMVLPFSRGSGRLCDTGEARKMVLMPSSWSLRGKKKDKAKKQMLGLCSIRRYLSFWRKL